MDLRTGGCSTGDAVAGLDLLEDVPGVPGPVVVHRGDDPAHGQLAVGEGPDVLDRLEELAHPTVGERLTLQRDEYRACAAVSPLIVSTPSDGGQSIRMRS